MKLVFAEILDGSEAIADGSAVLMRVVRIFRNRKSAQASKSFDVMQVRRDWAVGQIRHQLFIRSRGFCELCGSIVTEQSGHMHEQKTRGKGGEISMDNSVFICARSHKYEHRARNPQWKKTLDK